MNVTERQSTRFWTHVDIREEAECWLWQGHKVGDYGEYKIGSKKDSTRKNEYAHRVAYTIQSGEIPDGMHILHKCDVKLCCNPSHLEIGTCAKNHKDAWARGLRRGRKIGADEVNAIRASSKSYKELAAEYGLNSRYVGDIKRKTCWMREDMAAAGLAP